MGTAYYYFAASLPMLDFVSPPPMSVDKFLRECERLLKMPDLQDMRLILAGVSVDTAPAQNRLLQQWLAFDRGLRNAMAWFRTSAHNQDPHDYVRGDRIVAAAVTDCLAEASRADNPLEAERKIDALRWSMLDELVQGHFFDLEYLCVYALKLKILERYKEIGSPRGERLFEDYKNQMEQLSLAGGRS